jgi:hypothetical protein
MKNFTLIISSVSGALNVTEKVNISAETELKAIQHACIEHKCSVFNIESVVENKPIEFKRVASDQYGNPRYVCHYTAFQKEGENISFEQAAKRANKLGGRKFNNNQYGGGIVFQSYNTHKLEEQINELLKTL